MSQKPYEVRVDCKHGAPMGRRSTLDEGTAAKVRLRRVPFVDYCYDPGGAYWGMPANLYCAWVEDEVLYFRANSRDEAKEQLPNARFYR